MKISSLLVSVEVLDVGFKNRLGSNVLVKGRGPSSRKNSSGVLKSMPIFVARSLDEGSIPPLKTRHLG